LIDDALGLYVVSDGMGGHAAGHVASRLCVNTISRYVWQHRAPDAANDGGHVRHRAGLMRRAVRAASTEILRVASRAPTLAGMGATATAVHTVGDKAIVAHAGDSRLYLMRGGRLRQLTRDHTIASEMAEQGVLEKHEVADHPFSSILTRAVGRRSYVDAEVVALQLADGDRLLLCTDGITRYIDDPQWLVENLEQGDVDDVLQRLVDHVRDNGGADDATAVIMSVAA